MREISQAMRLCLVGPANSGKTSLLTTFYLTERNKLGASFFIKPKGLGSYEDGFFDKIGKDLTGVPIRFPEQTLGTDVFELDFMFRVVGSSKERIASRPVQIFDYQGGIMYGAKQQEDAPAYDAVRQSLQQTDAAIVLLSTETLLEANDVEVKRGLALGVLNDIIDTMMHQVTKEDDFLPLSLAVTQFDVATSVVKQEIVRSRINDLVIKPLFDKFSTRLLILDCPVSIVRKNEDGNPVLYPLNVDAPFLFAAAGTIFRGAVRNWKVVRSQRQQMGVLKGEIEAYRHLRLWERISKWVALF